MLKKFIPERLLADVGDIDWTDAYAAEEPEASLNNFMESFMKMVDKHAPMRKWIVKTRPAPWPNETLKSLTKERDEAKFTSIKSGLLEDRFMLCRLRKEKLQN